MNGKKLPKDLGFAGFRLNSPDDIRRDWAAFLGASYFRAVGSSMQYGLSARGLRRSTPACRGRRNSRTSPHSGSSARHWDRTRWWSTRYWIRPASPAPTASPSPGGEPLVMDIDAALYPRKEIERIGIAPATSMYQGRRERPAHGLGLARGDPRYRRAGDAQRQRRMDLAPAGQSGAPALQRLRRREPARLRPAAARPQLRPLPGRRRVLREAPEPVGRAQARLGPRLGTAGRDPDHRRDLRQHRRVLESGDQGRSPARNCCMAIACTGASKRRHARPWRIR